jgi:hypothetical protein
MTKTTLEPPAPPPKVTNVTWRHLIACNDYRGGSLRIEEVFAKTQARVTVGAVTRIALSDTTDEGVTIHIETAAIYERVRGNVNATWKLSENQSSIVNVEVASLDATLESKDGFVFFEVPMVGQCVIAPMHSMRPHCSGTDETLISLFPEKVRG